jgi:glutamate-ammonia-ligase adenylyltransferase
MEIKESLLQDLPDPEAARRFFSQFSEKHSSQAKKLLKNDGLLSDVLTIAAFSPLLATTILQNPSYVAWLGRYRGERKVRDKEELLESLARFSLVNSQVEPNVLLARFRRRELLRIFLRDIRRLATVSEITEELSNLADAILEYALRIARQELDNRYGSALETDSKGRHKLSSFVVVSLGKLGSKELNYSSDIDLLFIYSSEGATSGQGSRGVVTNREYFVKLAELVTKIVGAQTGEGAAYRVDLRLRPHGRVGALAVSVKDTIIYYQTNSQAWERQVLIRARSSAGEATLYKKFAAQVENHVFSKNETVENALENVRLSKEKINFEQATQKGFNVKLGRGGIREIEFIAQALQIAYGGADKWLRASHTLKSLARLADRKLLSENELTELYDAYEFLRRTEHLLQMENGLQTHIVPENAEKRALLAAKMSYEIAANFDEKLDAHAANVNRIFARIFSGASRTRVNVRNYSIGKIGNHKQAIDDESNESAENFLDEGEQSVYQSILASLEKSESRKKLSAPIIYALKTLSETSPHFAEMLASNPALISTLPVENDEFQTRNYRFILLEKVAAKTNLANRLSVLRKEWSRLLLEVVFFDVYEKISIVEVKRCLTELAEAAVEAAIYITKQELNRRFSIKIAEFPFAVLGLGKLGGKGMDYGSDLDLLLAYNDEKRIDLGERSPAEFYARAAEIFVGALSNLTRDGQLYRVDLRLRPDGKNGSTVVGTTAFKNYLKNRSAIWEWLAYVKLRGVAGENGLAEKTAAAARKIIHENACKLEFSDVNFQTLVNETRRVRELLEEEKSASRRSQEIDIKFGAGGMLDVYFAVRYLQLRHNIPDDAENRSTGFMLEKLRQNDCLSAEDFANLSAGYDYLSKLDHNLRLTVGRSTRLPLANRKALLTIALRMKLVSISDLLEKLTVHRLNIRQSFENILPD